MMHNKVIEVADVKRILDSANSDNVRRFCLRILAIRAQRLGEYYAYCERRAWLEDVMRESRKSAVEIQETLGHLDAIVGTIETR